jgi:hypothetical protein
MATVTKGRTFTSGETVTPAKLNDVVDLATVTEIVNADIKSDAAIAGTKIDPLVAAGTYTPTVTAGSNITSVTGSSVFQWMRIGSVVTASGRVTLVPSASGTAGRIFISLPIASTFTEFTQAGGVASIQTQTTSRGYGGIIADASTASQVIVNVYPEHTAGRDYMCHFTYQIL